MVLLASTPLDQANIEINNSIKLKGTDTKYYGLGDLAGPKGLLVMFICNHCPYVKAIMKEIKKEAVALSQLQINSVAISSNDPTNYKEDSFPMMRNLAKEQSFTFPYLFDETQEVAKAWGVQCTPEFFLFIKKNKICTLQYKGRLNSFVYTAQGDQTPKRGKFDRELFTSAIKLLHNVEIDEPIPSMGCSIKWKTA